MPTILTDDGPRELQEHARPGSFVIGEDDLVQLTGWELQPQGLCRGHVCVPARERPEVRAGDGVDLRVVAELLELPLAVDEETSVGALGTPAAGRAGAPAGLSVADLIVDDFDGNRVAWSSLGRKKKLLVAWASW